MKCMAPTSNKLQQVTDIGVIVESPHMDSINSFCGVVLLYCNFCKEANDL